MAGRPALRCRRGAGRDGGDGAGLSGVVLCRQPRPGRGPRRLSRRPGAAAPEPSPVMRPIGDLPPAARAGIHFVLTDIDDTLTTGGQLTAAAYSALERLAARGYRVIAV